MRKIVSLFILLCSVASFYSCEKWLDVRPKAEVKGEVMFESEQGLRDALVGSYILMSGNSLYGSELSITFVEMLAQQYQPYTTGTNYVYSQVAQYAYRQSSVETKINNMWLGLYEVIANVNYIIESTETYKDNISATGYGNIKGEALALRAFLHFDLMRLFSYGGLGSRQDVMSNESIPYRIKYGKQETTYLPVSEVMNLILKDLNEAIELLGNYDPVSTTGNRPDDYDVSDSDLFYANRTFRMNYNAALATKMRVLMWIGGDDNIAAAQTIAEDIIDSGVLSWTPESNINHAHNYERDLVFSKEQLFGVEVHNRQESVIIPYFKQTIADDANINYNSMNRTYDRNNDIYEINAGIGDSDVRFTRHFGDEYRGKPSILKFWQYLEGDGDAGPYNNIQPLIRTPEIYYTLAECLIRKGDAESHNKAIDQINLVRSRRSISQSLNLPYTLTKEEVEAELMKEWQKEMMGDGQLFFHYKRLNLPTIRFTAKAMDDYVYILPTPATEGKDVVEE